MRPSPHHPCVAPFTNPEESSTHRGASSPPNDVIHAAAKSSSVRTSLQATQQLVYICASDARQRAAAARDAGLLLEALRLVDLSDRMQPAHGPTLALRCMIRLELGCSGHAEDDALSAICAGTHNSAHDVQNCIYAVQRSRVDVHDYASARELLPLLPPAMLQAQRFAFLKDLDASEAKWIADSGYNQLLSTCPLGLLRGAEKTIKQLPPSRTGPGGPRRTLDALRTAFFNPSSPLVVGDPRAAFMRPPSLESINFSQFPVELRLSTKGGFGLFATRTIEKDGMVLLDPGFFAVHHDYERRCHHCTRPLTPPATSGEQSAPSSSSTVVPCPGRGCNRRFCSVACQQSAFDSYHAPWCGRDTSSVDTLQTRAVSSSARVWLHVMKMMGYAIQQARKAVDTAEAGSRWVSTPIADTAPLNLLCRLSDISTGDAMHRSMVRAQYYAVLAMLKEEPTLRHSSGLQFDAFLDAASMGLLNSACVADPDDDDDAIAAKDLPCLLPSLGSFFNHSCEPNVTYGGHYPGASLCFLAERPIAAGDELFIAYIVNRDAEKRQWLLKDAYGFDCGCPMCGSTDHRAALSDASAH